MYLLIFEPHMGCKKKFISDGSLKINLGKKIRDGYENIQLESDFLPDYVGAILYHKDSYYFRSYGKIKMTVNGNLLNDSSSAVKLVNGSLVKIHYNDFKNVYIAVVDYDIENKWMVFRPENNSFIKVQKDKKGYIICDAEDILYRGKLLNSKYFMPINGDIFIKGKYIFYSRRGHLFFDTIIEPVKNINPQPQKKTIQPQKKTVQPKKRVTPNKKIAILMKNVTRYDKKKKWYRLKNVNLEIPSGRLVAIMGVSGAGKSTLFDSILGNLKLDSGSITIDGNELGHVPQFSVLRKGITVQDAMEFYASKKLKKFSKRERKQRIDDLLDKLNLSLFKESLVKRLSGGQSRRLDIAVQLLNEPNVILMDEPDSGLDIKSCRELYEILAKLVKDRDSTILVITHNTHMACKYPYIDDLLFMASQGRICFYGDKNDALGYFNINDLDDIYNAVENNQDHYVDKYNKLIQGGTY